MGMYKVNGKKFRLPDGLQGQELESALEEVARSLAPQQTPKPEDKPFIEKFMDTMSVWEGTGTHEDIGGVQTGAFGVVNSLGVEREEGEDSRGYATRVAQAYEDLLYKEVPDARYMKDNVKLAALSMLYNTGKLFPGQKKALQQDNPLLFSYNLLDVVTQSEGPKIPEGERWVVGGLVKRRAREFNLVSEETGADHIKSYELEEMGNGEVVITYTTDSGMKLLGGVIKDKDKKLVVKGKLTDNVD